MSAWQTIRLLRARPPTGVNTQERLGVFTSALEQAEQLMRAAERVGPAAQPLPLFYSLSQAGRAIAAAKIADDQWRLAGHGLRVPDNRLELRILRRTVEPQTPSKSAVAMGRRDSFAGTAEAVGSGQLSAPVDLGAIWCAIPELLPHAPQIPDLKQNWRRPLVVFDTYWDAGVLASRRQLGTDMIVCGLPSGAGAAEVDDELAHYPGAAGAVTRTDPHLGGIGTPKEIVTEWTPDGRNCPRVSWTDRPERHPRLDQVAPEYRGTGLRLLMPSLPTGDGLSPLMLWWILLLGLSSVARYDPEVWVAALDVNTSQQAVPIESALDAAVDALPELILQSLLG
jgi:hypothetical protein